jgi:protein-L-isoaspartate(D-aspartate) O-methyltransferase
VTNDRMVDRLRATGRVRSDRVEAAFRSVDRGRFVPAEEAGSAYADAPIRLLDDADGALVSTISQPSMVAYMLEELAVQDGDRVLEVGTASGYDAALLACLAGPTGAVVTVEIDARLCASAAVALRNWPTVRVVQGDGHLGYSPEAPYDRIVVTAGAREVAESWFRQLVQGGRLVVPLTDARGHGLCVTFDLVDGRLVRRATLACSFVTMRRL